jgi:general secretion pathway protein D
MRFRLTLLAAAALVAATPALGQYTLNVRDADVRAFIQDAARVMDRSFIIDSRVQGKVSVITDRPLSRSEYFEIFLSTLRANGLVAVPVQGGSYRIQPLDGAATQPGRIGSARAAQNQFVTEIIRLRHMDAAAAIETLRPLVSAQGSLTANRNANSLVVADFADNIRRIRTLVGQIDRDNSRSQIVTLRNAGAREIATALQALAGAGGGEGVGPPVTIVPIDSSNAIALRGDATQVARFVQMAGELDSRAAAGTELRVYWLEHANAQTLLPTLQALMGGGGAAAAGAAEPATANEAGKAPAPAPVAAAVPAMASGGGGIVSRGPAVVTRYEGANAIIVAANPDVQRMIGELIRQLDSRREQVLVEAIIVEVGDAAAKRLGVQFLLGSTKTGFATTNYSNAQPNILTLAGAVAAEELGTTETTVVAPDGTRTTTRSTTNSGLQDALQQAAVDSLSAATGGIGGIVTGLGSNGIFGAIINAVKSDTESNLLATPHIVTLDNQLAKFLVGQEVPITTGEQLADNFDRAFRTVQRQEVGIKLEVTPQVNAAGEVKLFLKQEVSSIAGPVSSRSSDLILNKRSFETTLTVDDGDILAIGGLLNDDERRTIERIPLLSDIPLIGELFKSRSRSRTKTNLMVFIRPTILRTRADNQALTARRYQYVRDFQRLRDPDSEPAIDALVRDYLGTEPPVGAAAGPGDELVGTVNLPALRGGDGAVIPAPMPPSNVEPQP